MSLEVIHHTPTTPITMPPLLFVHGAWHGAWCWEAYFLPYFVQRGYNVYALSVRRHGKSTPSGSVRALSIGHYIEDVITVADQITAETGQRPVMIGHSLGGAIVQKYLEKRAAPGAALLASVPVSGTLWFTLRLFLLLPHAPLTPLKMLAGLWTYPLVCTLELARLLFFSESLPQHDLERIQPQLQDESFRSNVDLFLAFRPNPRAIHATKMLVLAAQGDRVFTLKEERATAAAYGADYVEIPDIAHDVMLDSRWEQAAETLAAWLEKRL